ncbi:hypothetical protein F511_16090 [Dorcoceras hygrometricum]|uniref:Uncharacterized protein n=1 Tax=Dorcoceras hygrometricum TaxID=472368 RepID=A0A2Z7C0V6_9LAMI|nr:hypothetical protein F511_16090 [Dorcoceras hygrometricum]
MKNQKENVPAKAQIFFHFSYFVPCAVTEPHSRKFGHQCPTSPFLPPRKVPLEDLIYTSCTDPIPQPAAARTPRLHQPSVVTHLFYAYVRKATNIEFNVFVLGRDLILVWVIHSLNNFAQLSKYASESVCVRFYSVSLNSQMNKSHTLGKFSLIAD